MMSFKGDMTLQEMMGELEKHYQHNPLEIAVPAIDPEIDPSDFALAASVRRTLEEHYPGWQWGIEIPKDQNVITIRNFDCNPRGNMGFVIHRNKLDAANKIVVMGAGEFLERYRMKVGAWTPYVEEGRNMHLEKPDG